MNALGRRIDFQRDLNGNLLAAITTRTTPTGQETIVSRFQYDASDRMTNAILADGSVFSNVYNAAGKLASKTDPLGRQIRFEYDPLGQLAQAIYPDGASLKL